MTEPIPTSSEGGDSVDKAASLATDLTASLDTSDSSKAEVETENLLDLTTPEITQKLKEAPVFAKKGTVEAREVTQAEEVKTILANGTEETVNTAQPGDIIVTNPSGEKYILKPDNFAKRYEKTDQDGVYRAKGMARAFPNPTGGDISIMAPWGEIQNGGPDCMIATIYDPQDPENIGSDRYIIGGAEFAETYAPYEEVYGNKAP